ncbi:cysteine protease [Bacillus amyloliquefaciens]|nr:cysteine protease [Bacillus amyloliquefaciens]
MSKKIAVLVTDQFEDTSPAEAEKEVTGRHGEKVKVYQAISDAGEFANERPDGFTKASAKI